MRLNRDAGYVDLAFAVLLARFKSFSLLCVMDVGLMDLIEIGLILGSAAMFCRSSSNDWKTWII